jgi:hypothetical protein
VSTIAAPAIIVFGCAALILRPAATWTAMLTTAAVGLMGLFVRVPPAPGPRPSVPRWFLIVAVGVTAFVVARVWSAAVPSPFSLPAAGANVLAGVAEEIFFRRLTYGWLARWGAGVAVIGSAIAFTVVHVPSYGIAALPVDFAAGLLFGWQRWSGGGWSGPAVTHVAANLLQMG